MTSAALISSGPSTINARIRSIRPVAERVVELRLEASDGGPLPVWSPGAHIDLILADDLIRQYSLCSDPADPTWRLGVLEEQPGRGGSRHVHHELSEGDEVRVSAPRNNFELLLGERPMVFVAGGIGVTPLLPMVAAAEAAGVEWRMLHLSRSRAAAAFADELAAYGDKVSFHLDSESGLIDLPSALAGLGANTADVYACGPEGLLVALEQWAGQQPAAQLRLERFSGGDAAAEREGDHGFVVEIADGTEIEVPAGTTILDALSAAGIGVLNSCQEGVCGTCETPVLEGEPDHRDQVLSEQERASGEMMMPCVSRCLGKRLVLDL